MECPRCKFENPEVARFCMQCGQRLDERTHVTVLYCDLSGYTRMSETLNPEEVKQIMGRIFWEITQVVTKYEGFIQDFIGDAVIVLFGTPRRHEDDPIRAIKVAREIRELVDSHWLEVAKKVGQPISVQTGIHTGLAVRDEMGAEAGIHGVAEDSINLSSRLCTLAEAGEILVCADTCRRAEGHFTFVAIEPERLQGEVQDISLYKVLSPKENLATAE